MGKLPAEEASAQRPPSSTSISNMAGNVAPAGKQQWPHHGSPAGNYRHDSQAHTCGKYQRWIQCHHHMHTTNTEEAYSAVSVLKGRKSATHTHPNTHTNTSKQCGCRLACICLWIIIKESPKQIERDSCSLNSVIIQSQICEQMYPLWLQIISIHYYLCKSHCIAQAAAITKWMKTGQKSLM